MIASISPNGTDANLCHPLICSIVVLPLVANYSPIRDSHGPLGLLVEAFSALQRITGHATSQGSLWTVSVVC